MLEKDHQIYKVTLLRQSHGQKAKANPNRFPKSLQCLYIRESASRDSKQAAGW